MTTRADLERIIRADPDDANALSVYADYLLQHGDPRGELIVLMTSREDDPARRRERAELLHRHFETYRRAFVPMFLPWDLRTAAWSWRAGFVERLEVDEETRPRLARILGHASLGFLRSLEIKTFEERDALVEAVAALPSPCPLRSLSMGYVQDFAAVLSAVPTVRRAVLGGGWRRKTCEHATLEELRVSAGSYNQVVDRLRVARLPALRVLEIDDLRADAIAYGIKKQRAVLEDLLASGVLPSLDELVLRGSVGTDALCTVLVAAPRRLRALALSGGDLTTDGIATLRRLPYRLQRLVVSRGRLPKAALAGLSEIADDVHLAPG